MLKEADGGALLCLIVTKHYQDIQIKETEMGEACGMHGK